MNIRETVAKAAPTMQAMIDAILTAEKNGQPIPKDALRVGGIASMIVDKGSAMLDNPEKFDKAANVRKESISTLATSKDIRAKAEGFLRLKSAERSLSAVHKVENLLTKMSEAPKPRGRKSRTQVIA